MNELAHIKGTEIFVPMVFCAFGFILCFFLRRGVNILLFAVFLFAIFKCLESLKYMPDWKSFDNFTAILQQLGKSILILISGMIGSAGTLSILLFLAGGVMGLVTSKRNI